MSAQGFSQMELARRAGVSQSTVGRVLNGTASATLDTLERIALALGLSVAEVIGSGISADPNVAHRSASRTEAERMAHLSQLYAACDDEAKILLVAVAERLVTPRPRRRK